jgi:DNA-directed RNA polymerase subunit beta'
LELNDIRNLRISLASPEQIRSWSYGEVTKPETINYRRLRPEKDGLFCEAIFGPTRDWQCYCGKYKKVRFRGIVCDKCGVEVTHSRVRRERMGHIELATPIAHIWYTRRSPSYLGLLLNISQRNLDRVLYYAQYIVTAVDEGARERALRRLEEELKHEVERLSHNQQTERESLEAQVAEQTALVESGKQAIDEEIQRQRDASIEPLMDTATRLRTSLDSLIDKAVTEDVVFAFNDALVVPAGEKVRREHIATFNKIVQDELTRIEEKLSMERDRRVQTLEQEAVKATRGAQARLAELDAEVDAKLVGLRERIDLEQDELMSITVKMLLNETTYRQLREKWGRTFSAAMGAEAVRDIVSQIDLEAMAEELRTEIRSTRSKQRRKKAIKRLQVVEAMRRSGNRPEWMILTVLPVIPPALRPMVQLDGGRFATSDLNDLYRRVVNRNNRLKHLMQLQAPEVIVRNEKRMLQEAVDSLIDNSRRGKAISLRGRRQLKSLSDMLKGKQGRFRRNLLGKRVDYSGRSVIVVGPKLSLHQCGLPKGMALELFRPFVMQKLVEYNYAINVKGAKRIIEREEPEVWAVLEEVVKNRLVLLNRAPTLHRLGIQAFEPVLVEGSAIHLHPLVCSAFNADFDGDQMAVHVPLSKAALEESRELMLSSHNLLRPSNGEPEVSPTKDMVMGCYYVTLERDGVKGEGKAYSTFEEVEMAHRLGMTHLHAKCKFYYQIPGTDAPQIIDTTAGRVLFNAVLPAELHFVNEQIDKGGMKRLVARGYEVLGLEGAAKLVDTLKDIGFQYAMRSGVTIAIDDIHVPEEKATILEGVNARVAEVERQYRRGLITDNERYIKTVELWTEATEQVTAAVARDLDPYSSLGIMVNSGSTKGGLQPIRQLAGMRGLMADPSGRIIDLPIRSNFREGLTSLEYFISTHGARKGLADTALRTADAGYLTRRLVDVAQEVIINEEDCGTTQGIWITRASSKEAGEPLWERLMGRFAAAAVVDPATGELLVDANEYISEELAERIDKAGVDTIYLRSPLTCAVPHGLCIKCYGRDLGRGHLVEIGEAVGTIAAQSIGEPGTQLTLRTFHTGGVAGASDITQGLPRVQELFEARIPKGQAIVAEITGRVQARNEGDLRWIKIINTSSKRVEHDVPGNFGTKVLDGDMVAKGEVLATRKGQEDIVAKTDGRVVVDDGHVVIVHEDRQEVEYEIPVTSRLHVEDGGMINAGDMITEGSKNPHEILAILGVEAVREYMVLEIQKVYRSQGVSICDKHIEVIIRQMLRRVSITESGESEILPGELFDRLDLQEINNRLVAEGLQPAEAEPVVLGITKSALNTESFLAAASFQHTISVLASAAIEGKVDDLRGLKESVLIGKLIPAGTGFKNAEEIKAEARKGKPVGVGLEAALELDDDEDLLGEFGNGLLSGNADDLLGDLESEFVAKKKARSWLAGKKRRPGDDDEDGSLLPSNDADEDDELDTELEDEIEEDEDEVVDEDLLLDDDETDDDDDEELDEEDLDVVPETEDDEDSEE